MRVRVLAVLCVLAPLVARPLRAQLVGAPFQVNSLTTGNQYLPAVAYDGDGNLLVAWIDTGSAFLKVEGQRYDASFSPLGAEFQVSESVPVYSVPPSVACDASGRCVIVWTATDEPPFYLEIHGRRLDSTGAAIGGEFRVNTTTTDDQTLAHVAVAPSGEFLVVWETPVATSIFAQLFGSSGAPSGGEFRVNTYTGGPSYRAAVAAGPGGFLVAWTNTVEDGSGKGVYAQRYSLSGARVGGEFLVASATLKSQYRPGVAFDSTGGFVIAWATYQPGGVSYQIHAQRFSSSGALVGAEFQVSTRTTTAQGIPTVAAGTDGGFLVTWAELGAGRARFFSFTGQESPPELALPYGEGLASDGAGSFVVVYRAPDGHGFGVFAQRLAAPPQPIAAEMKVDASTGGVFGSFPRVAEDAQGRFVVVWNRFLGGHSFDVAARRFDAAGSPLGAEFRVNDVVDYDVGSDVASLPGGGFVVAWQDYAYGYGTADILVRRFDASGNPVGIEQRANAATGGMHAGAAVASAAGTGAFVVAWSGPDGSSNGVFARRFSSAGTPVGSDIPVNTTVTGQQSSPSVASDGSGNFVVAWASQNQDGSDYGVYMRRFTSAGVPLTGELLVNTVTFGAQTSPKVGMNASGDFVVAFESEGIDGDGRAVRAQHYSKTGAALGAQFTVNSSTTGSQTAAAVSVAAGGDFVILWQGPTDGDGNGVFGQRYKKTGERVGAEFQVNTYTTLDQGAPAVALARNLVAAWQSQAQEPSAGVGVFERVFANPCGGDVSGDGAVNVADVFFLINYLFAGGPAPGCDGDVNGDSSVDVVDVFYLINFLFAGGPPPL